MILLQAAKLATAQRCAVRIVKQYIKGENFVVNEKIKPLGLKFSPLRENKDTYKSVPKRLAEYAKGVADATGEYSRNPIKKIVSWIKCYVQNFKDLLKANKLKKPPVEPPQEQSVLINVPVEKEVEVLGKA